MPIPDPAERITITLGGRTFDAGRRTAAHLQVTHEAFERRFPELQLLIAQPPYNEGVELSAGTHDKDGVPDWYVARGGSVLASTEADYWATQRFLREQGWAVWFRHTGSWAHRGGWHLHGVSLGCPGPVGIYVPGQIDDYYRHTLGLAGQHDSDLDKSWFPGDQGPPPWPVGTPEQWRRDIDATVFDYPAWIEENEMPTPKEIAAEVAPAVWNHLLTAVGGDEVRAGRLLVQTHNRADVGPKLKALDVELEDLARQLKGTASGEQAKRIRRDLANAVDLLEAHVDVEEAVDG